MLAPGYIKGTVIGTQSNESGLPGQNVWVENSVGRLVLVAKEHLRPAQLSLRRHAASLCVLPSRFTLKWTKKIAIKG